MIENSIVFTNGDKSIGTPETSTWISASGTTITVITYKDSASQSDADWHSAHARHYATMWAAFPPA